MHVNYDCSNSSYFWQLYLQWSNFSFNINPRPRNIPYPQTNYSVGTLSYSNDKNILKGPRPTTQTSNTFTFPKSLPSCTCKISTQYNIPSAHHWHKVCLFKNQTTNLNSQEKPIAPKNRNVIHYVVKTTFIENYYGLVNLIKMDPNVNKKS